MEVLSVKLSLVDQLWMNDDVNEAIQVAARRVARRYRGFISLDDLRQSGYMWLFQHPHRVNAELPAEDAEERDRRRQFGRLVRLFERALEGVARIEKAAASGYKVDDEAFYDAALLEELLPTIWQPDAGVNPPQRDENVRGSGGDPAEGNTWVAMVADMALAWAKADLGLEERHLLRLRYRDGVTLDECAKALGVTKETALKRLRRATSELAKTLHGVRPLYLEAEGVETVVDGD